MRSHTNRTKVVETAQDLYSASRKLARQGSSRAKAFIYGKPVVSALIGVGAGFVFAMHRRSKN